MSFCILQSPAKSCASASCRLRLTLWAWFTSLHRTSLSQREHEASTIIILIFYIWRHWNTVSVSQAQGHAANPDWGADTGTNQRQIDPKASKLQGCDASQDRHPGRGPNDSFWTTEAMVTHCNGEMWMIPVAPMKTRGKEPGLATSHKRSLLAAPPEVYKGSWNVTHSMLPCSDALSGKP